MSNSIPTVAQLKQQVQDAHATLAQTLSQYTDEQMTDRRDHAGWSIKDHLDHLAVWQDGIAALLERRPGYARYETMGVDAQIAESSNEDELNAIIRERTRRSTLAETRGYLDESQHRLLRALAKLSDADLQRGYSYYQPDFPGEESGRPIVGWIIGNSSGHYREHLPWIRDIAAERP